MEAITRLGFGIIVGLGLSGALVLVLVLLMGMPVWVGLVLLAVLDLAIIGGGYAAMKRLAHPSTRQRSP